MRELESNPSQGLILRKLLILRNSKMEKNHGKRRSEVHNGYTAQFGNSLVRWRTMQRALDGHIISHPLCSRAQVTFIPSAVNRIVATERVDFQDHLTVATQS